MHEQQLFHAGVVQRSEYLPFKKEIPVRFCGPSHKLCSSASPLLSLRSCTAATSVGVVQGKNTRSSAEIQDTPSPGAIQDTPSSSEIQVRFLGPGRTLLLFNCTCIFCLRRISSLCLWLVCIIEIRLMYVEDVLVFLCWTFSFGWRDCGLCRM